MFCVPYEPLPEEVRFWYDGKVLRLTEETEECATFYGRMLDHDYTTKEVFNKNFMKDWRKIMTEKIGNFRIEPPGLFRGRGEHPKQGMLKRRVMPEDVIVNCSKDSEIPEPPEGHKWKEVRHDPNVTWLASWTENIQNQIKYVMLNPASKLKGEKDMMKYEKARVLKGKIDKIRENYIADFKSKEMRVRQRS